MKGNMDVYLNLVDEPHIKTSAFVCTGVWVELQTFKNSGNTVTVRFHLGDRAVYDSYNLIYTGKITAISSKVITITEDYTNGRVHRLKIQNFARRNYDYDAERIAEHNSVVSMHI